ncbi:MAG: hypothetical protein HDQ88_02460 [Clostridia bacterium]|nr:hypothetical protein [Clostridia bacterium]
MRGVFIIFAVFPLIRLALVYCGQATFPRGEGLNRGYRVIRDARVILNEVKNPLGNAVKNARFFGKPQNDKNGTQNDNLIAHNDNGAIVFEFASPIGGEGEAFCCLTRKSYGAM